ncbi:MAG: DUF1501 domain-containing protein [Candidatus Andeanibacterium colombiense]|uniref:DUF1501 domain-containing protein n=1 Tax=Candidatus Andeanibacterium colombiense TaxID=3121345 RepID=A0AAJ6BNP3_9SPHN|nr:MAG: DUF1501 domain-containing protein [Sphingomonadaceae bacterium]
MAFILSRRNLIQGAGALAAVAAFPGIAFAAAATNRRFVFIIQRGAADGLAVVPPVGDPALQGLREALVDPKALKLDSHFALHSALSATAPLFAAGEARAYHAVATAYRERSHFDGQNMLESGASSPYTLQSGWIGRLLSLLPPPEANALALAPGVPLALRGSLPVATYSPNRLRAPSDDLLLRAGGLYEADSQFGPLWAEAMKTKLLTRDIGGNAGRNGADLGKLAASLLGPDNGARIVMIETGGWDTHSAQNARLSAQLHGLDGLLAALKQGLAAEWKNTLVLVATEFGRTAGINGTGGTDHGTASVALLLGGALPPGAPVVADWPGLSKNTLYEQRDLQPTAKLKDVVNKAIITHYDLDPAQITSLFI